MSGSVTRPSGLLPWLCATAWPEGSPGELAQAGCAAAAPVGAVWVCGAIAGAGRLNRTLEIVVSIFLLFLTWPSPKSANVCRPM